MGEILASRQHEREKIIVELLVDKDEYRQLRGEVDNVYLFSDRVANVPSRVSLRGRNEATKYFLIPRRLRNRLAVRGLCTCQRIEHDGKSIFVYVLDPAHSQKESRTSL